MAVGVQRSVLLALVLLALIAVSTLADAQSVGRCKAKTPSPAPTTKSPAPMTNVPTPTSPPTNDDDDDDDDDAGNEDDVVPSSTPTPKTPKPTSGARPSIAPTPPTATKKPTSNSANGTNVGGKCVTGDPTQYISKAYVDWIWEKRMKPHFNFKNFIFDQLMASNNGVLKYCVRWDSTNKLPKATAVKFQKMLERQYAHWNKWLTGYGCWPFETIKVEMVGVAVRDKNLLDWTDDSLGTIYEKVLDGDGIPMCPENCYKHRDFAANADTSACKGQPFDMSLWPTLGQGGGAGGDWGQRADEANVLSTLDSDSSVIVSHEIGHGFGLPDFYEPGDKPGEDLPKLIMVAGASMSVTEGDGWLLRRAWEHVRMRYPSTSG